MKINWQGMSPNAFEEAVACLLRILGYHNVTVRRGPQDDGWDIDAHRDERLPDGTIDQQVWKFECKRRKNSPAQQELHSHYSDMVALPPKPLHVVFVVSSNFSPSIRKKLSAAAAKDHVGIHFWEGELLTSMVLPHLTNPELRNVVMPFLEASLGIDILHELCANQVTTEIETRVGPKYLPKLYRHRPLEESISEFIALDRRFNRIEALSRAMITFNVSSLRKDRRGAWKSGLAKLKESKTPTDFEATVSEVLGLLSDEDRRGVYHASRFISITPNCFLTKDRAGTGKTNLFCFLASHSVSAETLNLFLTCKFDLASAQTLDDALAASMLRAAERLRGIGVDVPILPASGADLLYDVFTTLIQQDAQLVLFLDGINENRDLRHLNNAIVDFAEKWNTYPIKLIVSCRDIFWDFFSAEQWRPYLFQGGPHTLPDFDNRQIDEIITDYFDAFRISGRLIDEARNRCRHPLLLRFFCEAYKGKDFGTFQNMRLKDLFRTYWDRKCEEIAAALGRGQNGGYAVESFLFRLIDHMTTRRDTQLTLRQVEEATGDKDLGGEQSVYQRLKDENVIIEELPPEGALDYSYGSRRVNFVYDEFHDYMAALAYIRRKDWERKSTPEICADVAELIEESERFQHLIGMVDYLVLIAEERSIHKELCATLARLGEHKVLAGLVTKLRDRGRWLELVLRRCLETYTSDKGKQIARPSAGWNGRFGALRELLDKSSSTDVFDRLVGDEEP